MKNHEINILLMRIQEVVMALAPLEVAMMEKKPFATKLAFAPFNKFLSIDTGDLSIGLLKALIEDCHDHADRQDYSMRELMFMAIDRMRNIVNGVDVTTKRFK